MSVLFGHDSKIAIFSRFLKVAIATSNFMNKVYNREYSPRFSISMLKKIISLVWDYLYETRKSKTKAAEK